MAMPPKNNLYWQNWGSTSSGFSDWRKKRAKEKCTSTDLPYRFLSTVDAAGDKMPPALDDRIKWSDVIYEERQPKLVKQAEN